GNTIFLASDSLDVVPCLPDRVVIIAAGKIVAEGTPESLMGARPATTTVRFRVPPIPLPESLQKSAHLDGENIELETDDPTRALFELTSWAMQSAMSLDCLPVPRPV